MAEAADRLTAAVADVARPLNEWAPDYGPVLEMVGDARFVLLGEASHGTHEFYRERADITRRLIAEQGFTAVAVEADWPDAYRVNRYVRGEDVDGDAEQALGGFKRFPTWMWRNADVLDFVGWLRAHNDTQRPANRVGFYGLDLYSLFTSIEAVVRYLDRVDPDAARRARARYACFEHFADDSQAYGYAATSGLVEPCENDVVAQLMELRRAGSSYARRDGHVAEDEYFQAEQNARLAKNAEEYYRAMFRGRVSSWNLRDSHMVETLAALDGHLTRRSGSAKIVVWAHNSHLGDARATEMGGRGELNVGQLVRERYGRAALLVGFTTHDGTVTAASDWDAPAELKRVQPSAPSSVERLFHETGVSRFILDLRRHRSALAGLSRPRLERAIGVIYRPETERASHYFHATLLDQFDAVIHFDRTRAVEPLERTAAWQSGEPAETYHTGM
jgi:erythromycin esterase-like protein